MTEDLSPKPEIVEQLMSRGEKIGKMIWFAVDPTPKGWERKFTAAYDEFIEPKFEGLNDQEREELHGKVETAAKVAGWGMAAGEVVATVFLGDKALDYFAKNSVKVWKKPEDTKLNGVIRNLWIKENEAKYKIFRRVDSGLKKIGFVRPERKLLNLAQAAQLDDNKDTIRLQNNLDRKKPLYPFFKWFERKALNKNFTKNLHPEVQDMLNS